MYHYPCKVVRVVDGDTVDIDIDLGFYTTLRKQRIRLTGIDAPSKKTEEGKAATKFLKELAPEVTSVMTSPQSSKNKGDKKGKYGRWLGLLLIERKGAPTQSVNRALAEAGLARLTDG